MGHGLLVAAWPGGGRPTISTRQARRQWRRPSRQDRRIKARGADEPVPDSQHDNLPRKKKKRPRVGEQQKRASGSWPRHRCSSQRPPRSPAPACARAGDWWACRRASTTCAATRRRRRSAGVARSSGPWHGRGRSASAPRAASTGPARSASVLCATSRQPARASAAVPCARARRRRRLTLASHGT